MKSVEGNADQLERQLDFIHELRLCLSRERLIRVALVNLFCLVDRQH